MWDQREVPTSTCDTAFLGRAVGTGGFLQPPIGYNSSLLPSSVLVAQHGDILNTPSSHHIACHPVSLGFASDAICQCARLLFFLSHHSNILQGDLLFQEERNKQVVFANWYGLLERLWNGFLSVLFVDHLFPSIGAWKDQACPMQLPYAKYHLPGK